MLKVAKVFSITGKYLALSKFTDTSVTGLKHDWSREILNHFKINLQVIGRPTLPDESCILLGNHVSYLDIPVLLKACPEVTFVSKKEVKYWPVIGSAAVKMNTIFVERKNRGSRAAAKDQIAKSLLEKKQTLAIFPSGTTSIKPSARWQKGVFEIAGSNHIKIQPFKISYHPLRASAYIDDDNLLVHMIQLFKKPKIDVTIEFHEPVHVRGETHESDCEFWKSWCESSLSSGIC